MKKWLLATLTALLWGSLSADSMVWNKDNNFDGWSVFYNT